jgi:rod shape-determining protein MreD
MNVQLRYAAAALIVFIIQMTFVPLISVAGFTPDLLILWLVTMGIRRGRLEATIGGFLVGLLQDVTTTQFFGLAALSKSLAGYAAGAFFNENTAEQTLGSYRFAFSVLLISALHNVPYYTIFYQGVDRSLILAVAGSTVGTALYTAVVSVLPMFWFARRYRTDWLR